MHHTKHDFFFLTNWLPFKLVLVILTILIVAGIAGHFLDSAAISDQKKIYNQQQADNAKLAATAISDRLMTISKISQVLSQYSLKDYIENNRSSSSINKLFRVTQVEEKSIILLSLHTSPFTEKLTSDTSSSKLSIAHNMAKEWTAKYYSILSGMREGFITPPPNITEETKLIGMLIPIWIGKNFSGVLTVVIDLGQLIDRYMTPMQIGKYGSSFIVDGSGTVVFDQDEKILGKNVFDLHQNFPDLIQLDSWMLHEGSGKSNYTYYSEHKEQILKKLIAWDTIRLGTLKLVVAICTPEAKITKTTTYARSAQIGIMVLMGFTIFTAIFLFYYYHSKQILISQNKKLSLKDQIFEAIAANVPGIIYKYELTPPHTLQYVSPKIKQITGIDQQEFISGGLLKYISMVHPEDRNKIKSNIEKSLSKNESFTVEYRLMQKDGSIRWIFEKGTKLVDQDSVVGFILDITERKKREYALFDAENKYRSIVNNAPLGIFQSTPEGKFISANPQMASYYGYISPEELISEVSDISKQCYVSPESRKRLDTIINKFGRTDRFEAEHINSKGFTFWASETITAVYDDDGKIIRYEGFLIDISESKEHEETLRRLAMYDNLTGLPNRVLFDDRIKQAIAHAKRTKLKVAILYADLDNFKPVNDELGHIAGDAVLKEVVGRFKNCLRTSDTVSRIGGDEFIFILQDIALNNQIEAVAHRIIESMRSPFYLADKNYRLGVSIGITVFPDTCNEKDDLIRIADEAMYRAKANGKNQFSY
ncbi:sensor domain-containing diguanylate cyclase [Maridesulfovibrio zosterae]|uniref:sensor domain-containing diguanylate cyclase n=1 Tax=Maridesulfovibrio zosterae TaxID=82171 RepID=UPI0003F8D15E|nr:diguanylate cyclase [Maridesulfovibrio zosterae]